MTPSCHTKPTQICPVILGRNAVQLHSSCNGSSAAVSLKPAIMPLLLIPGHCTTLFGPPSVPSVSSALLRQNAATRVPLPGRFTKPAISPLLLMPLGRFREPPSVGG